MNFSSRLIQLSVILCIQVALANYVGRKAAAEIEAIYADVIRQLEASMK
ncbi:hypothetical protein [Mesorhizobium xinjiangense]|nr:hypothetical protein [Mesorhizobium xinjiangense]